MSEVYHPNGTPTGPQSLFPEWDLETYKAPTGWAWHTCNGHTLAASGTARTRTGARLRARLFALACRHHQPSTEPNRHILITLTSGAKISLSTHTYRVHASSLSRLLTKWVPFATARVHIRPVCDDHRTPQRQETTTP